MSWRHRIANVFRKGQVSRDIADELEFHIAERADELMAQGMSEKEARREAARLFGGYIAQREETGDMDIARWLEAFVGDLRYGARQLRLNPGFATVAVLSLALGIGANSGIFQLINALRLRSLPVPHAEELTLINSGPEFSSSGWFSGRNPRFTYPLLEQIRERQEAFDDVMAFGTTRFNMSRGGEVDPVEGLYVTPNFLDVLGVEPMLGGWLPADTDPRDCAGAGVLLNHAFWRSRYGGDVSVVGRTMSLDGTSYPVLGVTPPSFAGVEPGRRFDAALPVCADRYERLPNRTAWWLTLIGRLKPGWTVERASAHMTQISPQLFEATEPTTYRPDMLEHYRENTFVVEAARAGVSSLRRDYENPLGFFSRVRVWFS